MGSAASLFFDSSDREKQTLYRRVTPTDLQFEEQQKRWNLLADFLRTDLRERSGHPIRSWLQGSYKFGTQIRPMRTGEEFDIDLGVYYEWNGTPQEGKHSPKTLKSFVQDSLIEFSKQHLATVKNVGAPKLRCCRIHYHGSFHIDVPGYHLDGSRDARCLATESGWEDSDPKEVYLWFKNHIDEVYRYKVRRLVTYLKAWSALQFKESTGRPSSILATVLVADAAASIGLDVLGADDEALVAVVEVILRRLREDSRVPNPVDETENLVRLKEDQLHALLESLSHLLDIGRRALDCDSAVKAADIWQEAFEHFFPFPEAIEHSVDGAASGLPVMAYSPEILVSAVSNKNSNLKFRDVNKIGPIPKDCEIKFEITNSGLLPRGAAVIWMVRNEGDEAENINDLGHRGGTGIVATERSAYSGRHYMDCIVKHGGSTIGMRRVPVLISKSSGPLRNPPRPSWEQFRK